jgi:hypothetical protein
MPVNEVMDELGLRQAEAEEAQDIADTKTNKKMPAAKGLAWPWRLKKRLKVIYRFRQDGRIMHES